MEVALLVLAVLLIAGWLATEVSQRRRVRRFRARFHSHEAFRAAVDGDRVRRIREAEGDVAAVRDVRSAFPDAPFTEAARLVREL